MSDISKEAESDFFVHVAEMEGEIESLRKELAEGKKERKFMADTHTAYVLDYVKISKERDELATILGAIRESDTQVKRDLSDQVDASMEFKKERDEAIAQAGELRKALKEVQPYFEGEHSSDHPSVLLIQTALSRPAPESKGGEDAD